MKKIFVLGISLLTSLLLIPLSATNQNPVTPTVLQTLSPATQEANHTTAPPTQTVKILISKTGKTEEIPLADYLFGVVAGEMPALYETEALKAQAVCANTFLKWRQKENAPKGYDISDDFTTDQCYISTAEAREKWGSKADEYENKIRDAVSKVQNCTITYGGEIILSVYHAISGGITENAQNVWGQDYPYLQAVDSPVDRLSKNYLSTKTFTAEQIKNAFSLSAIPENPESLFNILERTPSGTVKKMTVDNKEFKGSEVRSLLDLKSSNFDFTFANDSFTFNAYGYGHGVGMSQNGANELAKQGQNFEQILKYYYIGTEIAHS